MSENELKATTGPSAATVSWEPLVGSRYDISYDKVSGPGSDRLVYGMENANIYGMFFIPSIFGCILFFAILPLALHSLNFSAPSVIVNSASCVAVVAAIISLWRASKKEHPEHGGVPFGPYFPMDTPVVIDGYIFINIAIVMGVGALFMLFNGLGKAVALDAEMFTLLSLCLLAGFVALFPARKLIVFDRTKGLFINGRMVVRGPEDIRRLKDPGLLTLYLFSNERLSGRGGLKCEVPGVLELSRITAVQFIGREDVPPEVNLVYDGDERTNVMAPRRDDEAAECAMEIAEFLKIPLLVDPQFKKDA